MRVAGGAAPHTRGGATRQGAARRPRPHPSPTTSPNRPRLIGPRGPKARGRPLPRNAPQPQPWAPTPNHPPHPCCPCRVSCPEAGPFTVHTPSPKTLALDLQTLTPTRSTPTPARAVKRRGGVSRPALRTLVGLRNCNPRNKTRTPQHPNTRVVQRREGPHAVPNPNSHPTPTHPCCRAP